MPLPMPKRVPEPGFYFHYKHDPKGPLGDYAYEVVGVGFHTEDDARPGEEHFVMYIPLYRSSVYEAGQTLGVLCFDQRPLEMWMSDVEYRGTTVPRYVRVTDPEVVGQLVRIKEELYGK